MATTDVETPVMNNGCDGGGCCPAPTTCKIDSTSCNPDRDECIPLDDGTSCIRLVYPVPGAASPPLTEKKLVADLPRKLAAELMGTLLLVMVVIGSGIMAQNITSDVGVQLTINSIATIGGLYGLIVIFGPVSGAHFNPCVSYVDVLHGDMDVAHTFPLYVIFQIVGGILGAILADIQFAEDVTLSTKDRFGYELWISEIIGTSTLIMVIHGSLRTNNAACIPSVVAMWVGGGYFFTNSTIFANPAVTIGRMFSNTFAGIEPRSAVVYIPFQIIGATLGYFIVNFVWSQEEVAVTADSPSSSSASTAETMPTELYKRACVVSIKDKVNKNV